jgi:hypothetical protein
MGTDSKHFIGIFVGEATFHGLYFSCDFFFRNNRIGSRIVIIICLSLKLEAFHDFIGNDRTIFGIHPRIFFARSARLNVLRSLITCSIVSTFFVLNSLFVSNFQGYVPHRWQTIGGACHTISCIQVYSPTFRNLRGIEASHATPNAIAGNRNTNFTGAWWIFLFPSDAKYA